MMSTPDDPSARRKCVGRSSRTGNPCKNWARKGGKVCNAHGGRAPQVVAAAARNVAEANVRRLAADIVKDATPVTDPLRALQALAGRLMAYEAAVAQQVDVMKLGYSSDIGTEQIKAAVDVHMKLLVEVRQVLTGMARLNIDDRLAAIQEGTATMIKDAVVATLVALGINGPAQSEALRVFSRELRVIQGGKAAGYS